MIASQFKRRYLSLYKHTSLSRLLISTVFQASSRGASTLVEPIQMSTDEGSPDYTNWSNQRLVDRVTTLETRLKEQAAKLVSYHPSPVMGMLIM